MTIGTFTMPFRLIYEGSNVFAMVPKIASYAVARRGFAQVPNYLLLLNQFLDEESRLSPVELLVLIELVGTWWKADEMPFPAIRTLSVRCGVYDRQVQRAISSLESRGLLKREKRRSKIGVIASNAYNLKPAAEFLAEVARMFPNEYPRGRTERLKLNPPEPTEAVGAAEEPATPRRRVRKAAPPQRSVWLRKPVAPS